MLLPELNNLQILFRLFLFAFGFRFTLCAAVAFHRGTPAGLGVHLLHRVDEVLAVETDLEVLGINGSLGKQVSAPGHFQANPGGRAIECRQPRFDGGFGSRLV